MPDESTEATTAEVAHLHACARAVGCTLESGQYEVPYGILEWCVTGPLGPRWYADLPAARWDIEHEMTTCDRLGRMREAMEHILADSQHPQWVSARAWWDQGGEEDDLSPVLTTWASRILRAAGLGAAAEVRPGPWDAERLATLVPRDRDSQSLHRFMRHARALASEKTLAAAITGVDANAEDGVKRQSARPRL